MKHKSSMTVHFDRDYSGEIRYHLFCCDMSSCGYTSVCEVDVEFETPDDFNPAASEIASLKSTKQQILAEAQAKVNEIDELIAKRTCLEYRP